MISLAGYEKVLGSLDRLGKMTGRGESRFLVEGMLVMMTDGRGLEGLDKARPWGAIVTQDEQGIPALRAFIPVSDLNALLTSLEPLLGKAEDAGDGVLELAGTLPRPIYLKQAESWLYIGLTPEDLAELPDDPVSLLGGLDEQYAIGVRMNLSGIPADLRQRAIEQVRVGAAMGLKPSPGETPEQQALRERLTSQSLDELSAMINEVEQVTIGWGLEENSTFFEVQLTAVPDSHLAAQMNAAASPETQFAGLRTPESAVRVNWAGPMAEADVEQSQAWLANLRTRVLDKLADEKLSDADREAAQRAVEAIFEVARDTVALGKGDGGLKVDIHEGEATAVLGCIVADGAKLQSAIDQLMALLQKDHAEIEEVVRMNVATVEGFTLHQVTLPVADLGLPDDRRKVVAAALGDPVVVVIGIGPTGFYVGAGREATVSVTNAIRQSVEKGTVSAEPLEVVVSMRPVARLVAAVAEDASVRQRAQAAADLLEQVGKSDQMEFRTSVVENGGKLRVEIDGAVLQAMSVNLTPPGRPGGGRPGAGRGNPRPGAPVAPPASSGSR